MFFQALIGGIATGSVYALIALGLVLIFKASGVINFAQGALVMLGAFIAYTFLSVKGLPMPIALLLAAAASAGVGFLVERLVLRHLTGATLISVIMVTLGISFVMEGGATAAWGTSNYSFPKILPALSVSIGGINISEVYIWGCGVSFLILVAFMLFFKYSRTGLAMRAVADNQKAAVALGMNPAWVFSLSWALSTLVAMVGGIMLSNIKLLSVGLSYIGLVVFPVVILGGLESIPGAVVGGLLIGVIESLAGVYVAPIIGGAVEQVSSFVVLLVILMVRPYGLFGAKEILRL